MEQEESLRPLQEQPGEKYICNAAVLPDWRPFPMQPSTCRPCTREPSTLGPVMIHGQTVAEYQQLYHSVVDPMLRSSTGRPRPYSLKLGGKIKQRLWEALSRPITISATLREGHQVIRESRSVGAVVSAPRIDVDISGEPQCQQPRRKRARR